MTKKLSADSSPTAADNVGNYMGEVHKRARFLWLRSGSRFELLDTYSFLVSPLVRAFV